LLRHCQNQVITAEFSCLLVNIHVSGIAVSALSASCMQIQVITADSATLEIGADVYFRVKDAIPSVTNVQDLNHSTRIICQTLLQKHIGKQTLSDIESDRASIANTLQVGK
jgi:regulator of protease activity HflC (stomatin/prohibitin superfamily)